MRDAYRAVNKANTEQRNKTMAEVAEYSPFLGSALSVLMMPADVIGAMQVGASALFGQPTDPNDPALQSTNARKAMQDAVAKKIAAEKGEQAAKQYRDAMGVAEAAYGIYLSAGGLSGVVDIGSSAATQYINLINSGVSPEAAGKLVGVQAVLDAVGETGVFDDAVGAAVKKTGLMDTLIEWGRKIPGAKQIIDSVEERLDKQLFKAGMDMYDRNLTRKQEKDWIELTIDLNDFTDAETAEIVKVLQEYQPGLKFLTTTDNPDISKRRTWQETEKVLERVLPGYDTQVSFLNQKPAGYGEKGSVRLDGYMTGSSVEAKNYNLNSPKNVKNMVNVIGKQFSQREMHLPEGTHQTAVIDILGQDISNDLCLEIMGNILTRTDNKMDVWFLR